MMVDKGDRTPEVYDHHFWESEPSLTLRKVVKPDGTKFRYFDETSIFSFIFFTWAYKWTKAAGEKYFDPYMLHPLPLADQILRWQPILSKHISDGIASLEAYKTLSEEVKKKAKKPPKYILAWAIWLTFWKRLVGIIVSVVVMNGVGMSVAIFLHKLLGLLPKKGFKLITLLSLAFSIIAVELFKDVCMDHINYYVQRLAIIMDSSIRITIFQHGLCYRRSLFGHLSDNPDACKSIIHGCSGEDKCSNDPFLCRARRYKNNEVVPKIYPLVLNDSYYIPFFVEFITGMIDFLTAFIYGMILMNSQFHVKSLNILSVSLSFVVCMVVVEITNGFLMRYYLGIRDHKIARANEVIVSSLKLVETMSLDDIGHNMITETRNDELVLVFIRFFLSLVNKVFMTSIMCVNIIILVTDFVGQVKDATNVESIDPSGLLASIFVIMKIIGPLYLLPFKLKSFVTSMTSFLRVERFLRTCSPNFYLPDNKFTGDTPLPEALPGEEKTLPKGLVVMFKKASFAWVNSRKDLLDNTGVTCLRDLDFVLNTGDLAIITGAQGSGKTNFVKAVLGDMTLVEGSMAALPLSTNMPIFYASQKVWLQKGTIKSNITFGHRFDEDIYKTVIKTVELEHDISTWEGGDMRKISENGYSLSGGQRMRVGLARAIYAYLIFSKTNRESESDHSFLVVIDDCFTGLDPFVAKTIFRNLFSVNGGLLTKGDVATVLTISRRILEACVSSESSESFPDAPMYALRSEALVQDNRLRSFMKNKTEDVRYPVTSIDKMELQSVPFDVLRRCSSDDFTKLGRRRSTESRYSDSPTVQHLYDKNKTKNYKSDIIRQFKVYFSAASWPVFLFLFLTLIFATLDSTKFIITSKVSDSIVNYTDEHDKTSVSLEDVKEYCYKSLRWILVLSIAVMIGAFFRIVAMTKASFNVSRRIHEYCIDSVFTNNSAALAIKKSLGCVITFFYNETLYIDTEISHFVHDSSVLSIETVVHTLTLFFMMPWSTPIAVILCFIILRYFVYYFVKSCKHSYLASMESFSQINAIIETAIVGSPIYRSFKKEWELIHSMFEHIDYNLRCDYLTYSAMFGTSIAFKCLLAPLALFILFFPIIRSRYFGVEIKVGYYAMAYSVFLSLTGTFSNFLRLYCYLELYMGSIRRFENFVLPGAEVKFKKKRNIHQTDVIVDRSASIGDESPSDENIKDSLRRRRYNEHAKRRAARCTSLKMLFFKHQVNILDISKYAVPGQVRVQLRDVSVHVTSGKSKEKHAILKNVTCSADTSDIIGIVGRTGAGKSTLLSVLQGLARNRGGSVLLDGCDLNDMPKNVTRQIIGVLPQLPFVFRGWTVRRFIDPRMLFDDTNIEMALENCGLLKFVENLSGGEGLDTIIIPDHYHKDMPRYYKRVYYGPTLKPHDSSVDNVNVDHGMVLSNSQLRTLSVARLVLYREFFKVLLVDEPPEDEHETSFATIGTPIYDLIKTHFGHCTTFIAAHDVSMLRFCTSVWVFHKGSLIRTCKTEDIVDTGSLSKIIEDCITTHA
ncbi:ABC transporter, ATP-binding protein domain containing protein [Theileria equi strain WA]|uniref:ABC transporter, ATP-binding protein domain containing protein n=1 Tax=Theileria equi strain WA TaxID=1537102 RepID=L0AYY0_THEEQ|nr:ABC transporter, ATP-binding protein domain containing protein [Theileria equi strain WA]AFZ80438.1 ABC transporter, ATP-binding protein domain containing protein [Theileria equi strain WA]|eukprot:XP_004830104.1 ABC transporter, ATP-binding protein domain containing protein [Theileria equi strain WA]